MHEKNFQKTNIEIQKIIDEMLSFLYKTSEANIDDKQLLEDIKVLENEQSKLDKYEFTFAVVGTMNAGKSTLINAIVGQEILPHRPEAMTTLPTLVTHRKGFTEPVLSIPKRDVYNHLIAEIQKTSQNKDNDFDFDVIQEQYRGKEKIFQVLKEINDIMRKAKEVGIEPPYEQFISINDFPRIEVEFFYLKEKKELQNTNFSLLDTPGPNEYKHAEQLREISARQTRQASAVMLVVDYTQISGESSVEIKEQVESALEYIGNDKTYILLNKFDEYDEYPMQNDEKGYEKAKEYFSKNFLDNRFDIKHVFPISARDAFYANIGLQELALHGQIDKKLSWVKNFGKNIIGRRWEGKLEDKEEVEARCKEALEDSYIESPIKYIIDQSYNSAQSGSLESAIQALTKVCNNISNLLATQENAYAKSIKELKDNIIKLKDDIDKFEKISQKIVIKTEENLDESKRELDALAVNQIAKFEKELKQFFVQKIQSIEEKEVESEKEQDGFSRFSFFWTKKRTPKENLEKLIEKGKIEFEDKNEAERFIAYIIELINVTLSEIQNEVENNLHLKVDQLVTNLNDEIEKELGPIAQDIEQRLGKEVKINLPEIRLLDSSYVLNDKDLKFSRHKKRRTIHKKQDSWWGAFKRMIDFADLNWGYDEYEEEYTMYSVTEKKILSNSKKAMQHVKKQIAEDVEHRFEKNIIEPVNNQVESFVAEVERLRDSQARILSQKEHSKEDMSAYIDRLKKDKQLVQKQSKRIENVKLIIQKRDKVCVSAI